MATSLMAEFLYIFPHAIYTNQPRILLKTHNCSITDFRTAEAYVDNLRNVIHRERV